ncbi:hypothetical protein KA005_44190 [bacterium]|nr:hypothetical protein [bacterium]
MNYKHIYQKNNFTTIDTGLRFKGHPVLLGSNFRGHSPNVNTVTKLDRFVKKIFKDSSYFDLLLNHSGGTFIIGAEPEKGKTK